MRFGLSTTKKRVSVDCLFWFRVDRQADYYKTNGKRVYDKEIYAPDFYACQYSKIRHTSVYVSAYVDILLA